MKLTFGKRSSGAGAGVLDAPEENLGRETDWQPREPAPAGMLHRARMGEENGGSAAAADDDFEKVYKPRRESMRYRLLLGMPSTVAGRIVGGAVVFLVLGVVAGAVMGVRSMLLHDERFVIATSSEIEISGNEHLTRAQILSVFGSDLERNIFKVPLGERRADLERLPWVQHATVMRLLPNTVRVSVTERVPVAFVRQGSQIGFVDGEGVLLDMPEQSVGDPHYSFPVLTGLSPNDPLSTRAARMDVYRKFVAELDSAGDKLSQSLSEVDVSNPEDVKALIPSGSTDILVHFGDENFLTRYKLFEQNLPVWKAQYPKLASVDTRYEHQMVLEMQPGTAVPLNGTDGSDASAVPAGDAAAPATAVAKTAAKPPLKTPAAKTMTAKAKIPAAKAGAKPATKIPAAKSVPPSGQVKQ